MTKSSNLGRVIPDAILRSKYQKPPHQASQCSDTKCIITDGLSSSNFVLALSQRSAINRELAQLVIRSRAKVTQLAHRISVIAQE